MTSFATSAQCSTSDSACRISPEQTKQVRPKLPLLKILQAAGAQGEIFTVKEVMHYLGQYIMVKQLYDQQEQHMVYCGGDPLGELLGRQSFSVKDPSPLYDMLRRNLVTLATATTDAAQTLALAQDHSMDIPSEDQLKQSAEESSSSRKRMEEGNIPTLPTSQHKCRNSREDLSTDCNFFPAKMTSFATSAQCSTSDSACRISPEQTNQVRPKLPLLKILQAAGAQGEIFTVKEVMHYLGQYIMVKQLYDQQEQHMVYCGGDPLGELLGRQSFSVKDPSPLYDMLRRNLVTLATATTDAAQTLALAQDHSMDIPSEDQLKQSAEESSSSRKRMEEGNIPTLPTSQHKCRNSREDLSTDCNFFPANMTSFATSAQCSTSDSACRISPEQTKQVRPKLPLLKILQAAGAQGEIFTVKEVMHYLGQYIMVKQLYDQQEQHMVYCGGDPLGELLGRQSFSVKDPSPLYDMLRRNLVTLATATTDAAQTLALAQDHSMDIPSEDQLKQSAEESSSSRKRMEEGNIPTLPTSQHKCRNSREDEDFIKNLTQDETSKLDLGIEEWDVAGLPWWFLGNLRSNYTPRSNGSTDLLTNQDIGTAIVSDTTDDLWFLNESVSEQFGVGIEVEAADTEQTSEEVGKVRDKKVIEVGKNDDLEDSKSISDDTDVEVTSEDEWQCTECKKFNSPSKRYCFRCWALRKDWYSDCSKLTHSLSTSDITAIPEKKENEGIDVPDCRRTISTPVVRPKDVCTKEEKNPKLFDPCNSVEFLDLAHSSESQETISSMGEPSDNLFAQRTDTENMEDCQNLLKPCSLCKKRPRDGNIIHGRTGHLVTCYHCARRLKKAGASCPICKKEIQLVIKVFIA